LIGICCCNALLLLPLLLLPLLLLLLLLLQAIKAGNTLYVSGQIGIVPGTKDFASEGVEGQTEQVRQPLQCIHQDSPEHPDLCSRYGCT
jgi:hypothetical protein